VRVAISLVSDRHGKGRDLLVAHIDEAERRLSRPALEQAHDPLDAAGIAQQVWNCTPREQHVAPAADLERVCKQLCRTVGQARRQHPNRRPLRRIGQLVIQRHEHLEVRENLLF
jgi:hypothetical protein